MDASETKYLLPARWTPMRYHPVQHAYWVSPYRFNTVPAGRRSGKTEIAKRKLVRACMNAFQEWDPRYFAAAPTRDQAKRIFWEDLKALTPKDMMDGKPSESDLTIYYITGAWLTVIGLDVPQRIEGSPWDGGVVTEVGNVDKTAWPLHIRPALSDRKGWCDLEGVPEGRNHYYEMDRRAKALMKEKGLESEWGSFHWKSSEILDEDEIRQAQEDLDELSYEQEYNASFINFTGRAYYPFLEDTHTAKLSYNPRADLVLCFDFNVEPGVAAIIQEQALPGQYERGPGGAALLDRPIVGTGVIGEVWIPQNSNTESVCKRIIKDWGKHQGRVRCYGDATGGARGSAKVAGSDWDIIEAHLRPTFRENLSFHVKEHNPKERARINAVNSRLKSKSGTIRMLVDGHKAPHVVTDFEGVPLLEGGSGEIDKKKAPMLTHISDAIGYYLEKEYPVIEKEMRKLEIGGV